MSWLDLRGGVVAYVLVVIDRREQGSRSHAFFDAGATIYWPIKSIGPSEAGQADGAKLQSERTQSPILPKGVAVNFSIDGLRLDTVLLTGKLYNTSRQFIAGWFNFPLRFQYLATRLPPPFFGRASPSTAAISSLCRTYVPQEAKTTGSTPKKGKESLAVFAYYS